MRDDSNKDGKNKDFPMLGNNQNCNCGPDECCPDDANSAGQSHKGIRTAVFLAVMLAAVVVGAYSLMENSKESDNLPAIMAGDQFTDSLTLERFDFIKDFISENEAVVNL